MEQIEWSTEAEYPSTGCSCFWHRRAFVHINANPMRSNSDVLRLPLARKVIRTDYQDRYGRIEWTMELRLDGLMVEVRRLIHPALYSASREPRRPRFQAIAGDPRQVNARRLERIGTAPDRSRDGGDPTLVYSLLGGERPALVIWPEAWWWHLTEDGRDPLSGCEAIGAVSHFDNGAWSLRHDGDPTEVASG